MLRGRRIAARALVFTDRTLGRRYLVTRGAARDPCGLPLVHGLGSRHVSFPFGGCACEGRLADALAILTAWMPFLSQGSSPTPFRTAPPHPSTTRSTLRLVRSCCTRVSAARDVTGFRTALETAAALQARSRRSSAYASGTRSGIRMTRMGCWLR